MDNARSAGRVDPGPRKPVKLYDKNASPKNQSRSSLPQGNNDNPSTSKSDMPSPPDRSAPPRLREIHPVLQWILYLSRKFLQIQPTSKVIFYLVLVFACSLVSPVFDPFRDFYFFRRESFLNQWFVKWSWGWTFWLLVAFFGMAGYVESDGRLHKISRNITRLLVGTAVWFVVTNSILGVERKTGQCSLADHRSRKACVESKGTWSSLDISGHAFLLIYCSLLILEESRGFFKWEKADRVEEVEMTKFDLEIKPKILIVMRILAVALALLSMLWDGMVVITLIYYHMFTTRLLGVICGILGWFLTYKVWYPNFWPGLPGDMTPSDAPQTQ